MWTRARGHHSCLPPAQGLAGQGQGPASSSVPAACPLVAPLPEWLLHHRVIMHFRVPSSGPISTPSYSWGPDSDAKPNSHCPLAAPQAKYVRTQTRAMASPAGQGGWASSPPLSLSCCDGTIWLTG